MEEFKHGDLIIRLQQRLAPPCSEVVWLGRSTDERPRTFLSPYFAKVLADAVASGKSIEMRFDKLEQVNSSTISAIMQVLQEAKASRVPMVVMFDPARRWQKSSFDALRVLVTDDGLLELRHV